MSIARIGCAVVGKHGFSVVTVGWRATFEGATGSEVAGAGPVDEQPARAITTSERMSRKRATREVDSMTYVRPDVSCAVRTGVSRQPNRKERELSPVRGHRAGRPADADRGAA